MSTPVQSSADWWDNEFGPAALNLQDNPVLALNLAQMSAPRRPTLDMAHTMNQEGGADDYSDENTIPFS